MRVIAHRNVNTAYGHGLHLLQNSGVPETSRVGDVLVYPEPFCTVYFRPNERVLFSPNRDANPYFHLFESMWMLAGRRDGAFLDRYVADFTKRYGEANGDIHGAYGHRWRRHWEMEGGGGTGYCPDQLSGIIQLLTEDRHTRQAVLTMWDPVADLGAKVSDKPCNTHVYFRVQSASDTLDMTVLCRSNDAVWGAYGSNAVQFSVLQEFVATAIGAQIGSYRQVSNNFHVYKGWLDAQPLGRVDEMQTEGKDHDFYSRALAKTTPLFEGGTWGFILQSLEVWCDHPTEIPSMRGEEHQLFTDLLVPMARSHLAYKEKRRDDAKTHLQDVLHTDWRIACEMWLERRWEAARVRRLQESGV